MVAMKYELVDLSAGDSHWRHQLRGPDGRWIDSGGAARSIAKHAIKASLRDSGGSPRLSQSEVRAYTEKYRNGRDDASRGAMKALARTMAGGQDPADHATVRASMQKLNLKAKPGSKEHAAQQARLWRATPEERKAMLEGIEDPLAHVSDEDLYVHLQGEDPEMRKKALKALEARRQRLTVLAEAAHSGLKIDKTKEALSKWDQRLAKVPGGKGFLKLRDRLAKDENILRREHRKDQVKGNIRDTAVYIAVGTALFSVIGAAIGYAHMKTGGGPDSMQQAQEWVQHFLHSGPHFGTPVSLNEALAALPVQALIVKGYAGLKRGGHKVKKVAKVKIVKKKSLLEGV